MVERCIIVGMSHAGIHVATALRQQGWVGEIIMVGDEETLPYHHPPLSKSLLDEDFTATLIYPEDSFKALDIKYRLSTRVEKIFRSEKFVVLQDGERLHYDKLVLCTGARARPLNVKGAKQTDIHYLRNLKDALRLRHQLKNSKKVLIIGAGFIGLEIAASLKQYGIDVKVLEVNSNLLMRNLDSYMSHYFKQLHLKNGVEIITNMHISHIEDKGTSKQVICIDGTIFEVDTIIVGIGVIPNIELAQSAGLATHRGIFVDECGCTTDPNIYAAGDCTVFTSTYTSALLRLECLSHAVDQAKVVAENICGYKSFDQNIPWFWSEQYDHRLQIVGLLPESYQVIERHYADNGGFSRLYFEGQTLKMCVAVNAAKDFIASKQIISQGLQLDLAQVADLLPLKECLCAVV